MKTGVQPVTRLDFRVTSEAWAFAQAEQERIAQHWADVTAANPALWNGKILMCRGSAVENGTLSGQLFETDFASFVAWRDWGLPDPNVHNCFGSAVIRGSDGALVYGRMGAGTLNPGFVYPPGGSLEPGDIARDGSVDILASIERELAEETGLDAREASCGGLVAVAESGRLSVGQVLRFDADSKELAARIARFLAAENDPELAGAVIVRSTSQINSTMPGYAAEIARYCLDQLVSIDFAPAARERF